MIFDEKKRLSDCSGQAFLSLDFETLPKRNHGGQNRKKKNDKVIDRWTEIRIDFKI